MQTGNENSANKRLDAFLDVPGHLYEADGRVLQELASGCKHVLEIGGHLGRSTAAMLAVARHVTSIDWYKGDSMLGAVPAHLQAQNLISAGFVLGAEFTLINDNWVNVLPMLYLDDFDFIFYDAAHCPPDPYEQDFLNIMANYPHIKIAVHDYKLRDPSMAFVVQAVDDFALLTGRDRQGPVYGSSVAWFDPKV